MAPARGVPSPAGSEPPSRSHFVPSLNETIPSESA
jgi:hypothetical protein